MNDFDIAIFVPCVALLQAYKAFPQSVVRIFLDAVMTASAIDYAKHARVVRSYRLPGQPPLKNVTGT